CAREPLRLAPRVVAARGRLPQAPQGPAPHPEPRDSRGRRARRLARPMRGPGRIAQGLLTDATRPVGFRFDGRGMSGLAGDTLASALLASGVRVLGRSFKYHRPRGIVTAGPEEPCALIDVIGPDGREPIVADHAGPAETLHEHADVLVVGAGAAGLAAAHWLGARGLRVLLAEQDVALGGGSLLDGRWDSWRAKVCAALRGSSSMRCLT